MWPSLPVDESKASGEVSGDRDGGLLLKHVTLGVVGADEGLRGRGAADRMPHPDMKDGP